MKMASSFKTKSFASIAHLSVSLMIFFIAMFWVLCCLYPKFFFNMAGGWQGLALVFGVDVVLGPLLTFVVFNPSKKRKEVISDFLIIAAIQFAALFYGLRVLYQEHAKLFVLYEYGNATVVTHREVMADPLLVEAYKNAKFSIAGVPTVLYRREIGNAAKVKYVNPEENRVILNKANGLIRNALSEENLALLKAFEQKHGEGLVLEAIGKYTGAYIVIDKENLSYIGKIGEKEL